MAEVPTARRESARPTGGPGAPPAPDRSGARSGRSSRLSLVWRVFLVNAFILLAASAALIVTPVTVSSPAAAQEVAAIAVGLCLMLIVDLVLIRRALMPLQRLAGDMRHFDPLEPERRAVPEDADAEVATLAHAYNDMIERLAAERRGGAERAVRLQEAERRRVARELHDQVGQSLTAMLLQAESAMRTAPDSQRPALDELRQAARSALEDVRRIAMQLRPQVLDDLGLSSALLDLCRSVSRAGDLEVVPHLDEDLPGLGPERDLLVFRVAQESLTNVLRHAGATRVELSLERDGADGVLLTIVDDGRGIGAGDVHLAGGIRGMRERALLADAALTVEPAGNGGTEVRLRVPPPS